MTSGDMAQAVLSGHADWLNEIKPLGTLRHDGSAPTQRSLIIGQPSIQFRRAGAIVTLRDDLPGLPVVPPSRGADA